MPLAKKRPINLDLRTIAFPPTAIASILHRISGVVLFIFFPFLVYLFQLSLQSSSGFACVSRLMQIVAIKLVVLSFLFAMLYHSLAGVRHMVMDFGYGESLSVANKSAVFVIAAAVVITFLFGVRIW